MQDVFPPKAGHPAWGVIGPRAVTDAWGGAAFDSKRGILVLTGGGHADYGGNEVYHFDIETLKWQRVTEPSPMKDLGGGIFEVTDGEAPISSHTYFGLIYLPNVDRVLKFGGSNYINGGSYDKHAYLYDVEKHKWKRGAKAPKAFVEVAGDFDPVSGNAVFSTGVGLLTYDPIKDSWGRFQERDGLQHATAAIVGSDPRVLMQLSNKSGALQIYELDRLSTRAKAPIQGPGDWPLQSGMALHTPTGRVVIWGGGREVWTVTPKDWTVTKHRNQEMRAPTEFKDTGRKKFPGIYGRWRYIAKHDVFIGYAHSGDNVWFYKLPKN